MCIRDRVTEGIFINDMKGFTIMEVIKTKKENFTIRFAEKSDMALILNFIRELADYENLLDEVVATEEVLMDSLFHRKAAEVIIGEYNLSLIHI